MGPKLEVSINFVEEAQGKAIITNPEHSLRANKGESDTVINP